MALKVQPALEAGGLLRERESSALQVAHCLLPENLQRNSALDPSYVSKMRTAAPKGKGKCLQQSEEDENVLT